MTPELLDKCRKLARLASSPVNSHEAALAASRLAEIMVKHQISEVDLSPDSEVHQEIGTHLFYRSSRKSFWRMRVASGCSRLFNCISYWCGSDIRLIGREEDVNLCKYLFENICAQMNSLCDSEWSKFYIGSLLEDLDGDLDGSDLGHECEDDHCISCDEGQPENECPKSKRECGHHCNHSWTHDDCCWCNQDKLNEESRRSWSHSFLLSCSSVVRERLLTKHKQMLGSLPVDSKAMVKFNDRYQEALDFAKSMEWSKTSASPTKSSYLGSAAGSIAGSKVRIDKEMTNGNIPLLKG